jgi:hypothetical protein
VDYREAGGLDPLDSKVPRQPPGRLAVLDVLLRTRASLGLEPLAAPALVFVPLGIALGPHGLGVLASSASALLHPAVTVALATLGVFIGLALAPRDPGDHRLLAAASLEALTAFVAVSGASVLLLTRWGVPLDSSAFVVAAVLGASASVSSAGGAHASSDFTHATATRIADLDDGFAVAAGALAVAAVHATTAADMLSLTVTTLTIGALGGVAGWLLVERARGAAERGVFVLGTLALVGGAADYVRCSPMLAGLVAGWLWRMLPGHADRVVRDDVRRFQHPLVVLLLVAAGAWTVVDQLSLWLLGPFVVFRFAGKVLGARIGAALVPGLAFADLAAYLLAPGLIGIAVALNLLQVSPSATATAVLSAVALGTLLSELLAAFVLAGGPSR